jgi:hypothetical protein
MPRRAGPAWAALRHSGTKIGRRAGLPQFARMNAIVRLRRGADLADSLKVLAAGSPQSGIETTFMG